ncbi:MAG: hypothetical protein KDA25_07590 [Phycisphaerales bacterium]|nr:hypothetical protein [Phycisphaerales bacterium]
MDDRSLARRRRRPLVGLGALLVAVGVGLLAPGCGPQAAHDPMTTVNTLELSPRRYEAAMTALDAEPRNPEYLRALRRFISDPGYTLATREAAFLRLERHDPAGLHEQITLALPRLTAIQWRRRLCELIAERKWTDLAPTLVRAWAEPMGAFPDEKDRPEYQALATMYGDAEVDALVFDLFVTASDLYQHNLRLRCWELLHRLGFRDRLVELVRNTDPGRDALLIDLRQGAIDLGIVPWNRQEILWLRVLRQPAYAGFWAEAIAASQRLTGVRALDLELRDLPVIVAAARHQPELLGLSTADLYTRAESYVRSGRRHLNSRSYDGLGGEWAQRLFEQRDRLTWGDLAAILMASQAMAVPEIVGHLFDYADRDLADRSTEYGGLVQLDPQGRFEVVEFVPTQRRGDFTFIASVDMIERGYTSLFHFHFHAQDHDSARYAGPGFGDSQYADVQRTNCLVFTFIDSATLNVDYYRHDRVIVDLGEIKRP